MMKMEETTCMKVWLLGSHADQRSPMFSSLNCEHGQVLIDHREKFGFRSHGFRTCKKGRQNEKNFILGSCLWYDCGECLRNFYLTRLDEVRVVVVTQVRCSGGLNTEGLWDRDKQVHVDTQLHKIDSILG